MQYLGFQNGIDLIVEVHIAPLSASLLKKFLLLFHAKLSLTSKVVLVNHVLLATMWHVASCWAFSKACIGQTRRLVRNFLWPVDEQMARAKVAWM
jgi:hypothetical protein